MTTIPATPGPCPVPEARGGPGGDPGREDGVDVLDLAGLRPAAEGQWLLITEPDSELVPGSNLIAHSLPDGERRARGGDVLVHLATEPGRDLKSRTIRAGVWAVMCGFLVPVGEWGRQDPEAPGRGGPA